MEQDHPSIDELRGDLQAARRELEIQAGLDRVRVRTMDMGNSDELQAVSRVLCDELAELLPTINGAYFALWGDDAEVGELWYASNSRHRLGRLTSRRHRFPMNDWLELVGLSRDYLDEGHAEVSYRLTADMYDRWTKVFSSFAEELGSQPSDMRAAMPDGWYQTDAHMPFGSIGGVSVGRALDADERIILQRFAREFELAYRRVLDLEQAEEAARQSRIEAALERVRAQAMAMQSPEDIAGTTLALFDEVIALCPAILRLGVSVLLDGDMLEIWAAGTDEDGRPSIDRSAPVRVDARPEWGNMPEMVRDGTTMSYPYAPEMQQWVYEHMFGGERSVVYSTEAPNLHVTNFPHSEGHLFVVAQEPLDPDTGDGKIVLRFSKAFALAFKRYRDLELAAEAAREARIESALERVRTASMAMKDSHELENVVRVMFQEMRDLETHTLRRTGLLIHQDDGTAMNVTTSTVGTSTLDRYSFSFVGNGVLDEYYEGWIASESRFSLDFEGERLHEFIDAIERNGFRYPEGESRPSRLVNQLAKFSKGSVNIVSTEPISASEFDVLERFARVFDQAYVRFEELRSAEARALEARRQAALDRIRGAIATMRAAEDLEAITPMVWKELQALGVPFVRCGLLVMDEHHRIARFYLSHPDGRALAALELHFEEAGVVGRVLDSWRRRASWIETWDREQFTAWSTALVAAGQIERPEDYYASEAPPERITLQFLPFEQGMFYVGSEEPLDDGRLAVVQNMADAFAVAYARYADFQVTERALAELRATQAQLVEQEKLASLGQLTAGIAHEIKNPLNFVNNFAEVNAELADELAEAVKNGDADEAAALLTDLRENATQIAKHGRRADSIVRAMMQHARGGASEKESIDVNEFLDEYAALAWHGMRARDDSFHAEVVRDFDEAAGTIAVLPQELGRVVLNLLNNSFDALRETEDARVTMASRRTANGVEITVSDNGPGIPEAIREKIFEPFFTTKPTGEGTGLGLSLSYDIITKGHGGTMTAGSGPDGGAVFRILLPGGEA